ncbi:MAG: sugar transferase [Acetivibrionales bacterium]
MKNRPFINIVQIIIDSMCLFITYLIAVFLTGVIFHKVTFEQYLWIPVMFGMVYIFSMYTSEMYHRSTFTYQDRTLRYVIKSCLLAVVFCFVMTPFTSKDIFTVNILLIYTLAAIIVISMQYLIVQEFRQVFGSKWNKRGVLVGCSENIQEYLYFINKTSFQIDIAECIYLDEGINFKEKNQEKIGRLNEVLKESVVDEVIFAVPCSLMEEIRPYVLNCKDRDLTIRLAVDFFEGTNQQNTVHSVGTIPVFTYYNAALNDLQSIAKRGMDIIGALIGLGITLLTSAFIIPLALIQTGRPVFRRRKYLSVNGRTFTLYSFRTVMENDSSEYFISRFLRRTSMDNLPVFWNVLKGEMSLVGSMPIPAFKSKTLTSYNFRNTILKPGLTGNWRFKDMRKLDDGDYLAELNNSYLNKWSFTRDCWIILRTIVLILSNKAGIGPSLFACLEESHAYSVK